MNWDAIGSIAEALGAAGVIVTLAFLVGQLRMNNRLMRAESERITTQLASEMGMEIAKDRDLAELFRRGLADPKSLDPTDRIRFTWMMGALMNQQHLLFYDIALGLAEETQAATLRTSLEGILDAPGGRWFWRQNKSSYEPSLIAAVERAFEMD